VCPVGEHNSVVVGPASHLHERAVLGVAGDGRGGRRDVLALVAGSEAAVRVRGVHAGGGRGERPPALVRHPRCLIRRLPHGDHRGRQGATLL